MPSLFKSAAALAMAGAAVANPLIKRDDACLAAVTGTAALGDANIRKEHCSSFIKTIVTSAPVTVTTTITDAPAPSGWKRDVIVCPNEVPNYASACNDDSYKSACSVWGVTGETTITVPASTTTQTVYAPSTCPSAGTSIVTVTTAVATTTVSVGTVTSTVTATPATTTVTVTAGVGPTGTGSPTGGYNGTSPSQCISDAQATEFAAAFKDLLQHTSYNGTQGPPGSGYDQDVSDKYLATTFTDYSDSINWMAGFPVSNFCFILLIITYPSSSKVVLPSLARLLSIMAKVFCSQSL